MTLKEEHITLMKMTYLMLILIPMAETPRHGDIVADTENVSQTIFIYINENSCCFALMFDKLSATFGQFLLTVNKKLLATFEHFFSAALHTGMKVFHL